MRYSVQTTVPSGNARSNRKIPRVEADASGMAAALIWSLVGIKRRHSNKFDRLPLSVFRHRNRPNTFPDSFGGTATFEMPTALAEGSLRIDADASVPLAPNG